jgi:2-polyprenyl-3-methyl-5-hydroxy-6-metoxy-1,4-benzoquinol methylase
MGLFYKLRYKASEAVSRNILFPLGIGRPWKKESWEDGFSKNHWDYIENETTRYEAIAAYYALFNPTASVLDVGCGKGGLYHYLKQVNPDIQYFGLDISENAVNAATKRFPNLSFQQLDFDKQEFDKKFDIIIFNEVIEFFTRPVKRIRKSCAENLHPGGAIIISMFQGHDGLWKQIDKNFNILKESEVRNEADKKWKIKLLDCN